MDSKSSRLIFEKAAVTLNVSGAYIPPVPPPVSQRLETDLAPRYSLRETWRCTRISGCGLLCSGEKSIEKLVVYQMSFRRNVKYDNKSSKKIQESLVR